MSVGLRWEATGVTGSLFPALDADIRITDNGGEGSRVALTGSYRPCSTSQIRLQDLTWLVTRRAGTR
jgi:hypothetical protein